jgi:hypothetical protein
VQGRSNPKNYGNYNHNSYQNNQWDYQFQQPSKSCSKKIYQNTSFPNQSSRPQFNQPRLSYIAPTITQFIQGKEKMNQVLREQLQAISSHLAQLNAGEQGNENFTNASTSADRDKLHSKSEINPKGEAKAITSKDEFVGFEFLDVQKIKETLRSGTSYQGPTMLTNSEGENMRGAPDEHLVNLEELVVKEVPYEQEPERAKPTSSISPQPKSKPARTSMNTKTRQLYQPLVSPAPKIHAPNIMNNEDQATEYDQILEVSSYA